MKDKPNIILTGFMATGKTTVGRIIAERLGYEFVDTDEMICQRHGPLEDLFQHIGESGFRDLERHVAAECAARAGLVVATGGRMMLDEVNAAALAGSGTVVCLVADIDVIVDRVMTGDGPLRPLLDCADPRVRCEELMAERAEGYARFEQLDTSGMAPDDVCDAVLALVGS